MEQTRYEWSYFTGEWTQTQRTLSGRVASAQTNGDDMQKDRHTDIQTDGQTSETNEVENKAINNTISTVDHHRADQQRHQLYNNNNNNINFHKENPKRQRKGADWEVLFSKCLHPWISADQTSCLQAHVYTRGISLANDCFRRRRILIRMRRDDKDA